MKMLCLSMTSSGSSVGLGVGESGSLGAGGMLSESATALASRFTRGPRPTATGAHCGAGCFVLFGLLCLMLGGAGSGFLMFVLAVGASVLMFAVGDSTVKKQLPHWEEKTNMYEHGWLCLQCGNA